MRRHATVATSCNGALPSGGDRLCPPQGPAPSNGSVARIVRLSSRSGNQQGRRTARCVDTRRWASSRNGEANHRIMAVLAILEATGPVR